MGSGEAKAIALKQQFALENLASLEKEFFSIGAELRRQRVDMALIESKEKTNAQSPLSED